MSATYSPITQRNNCVGGCALSIRRGRERCGKTLTFEESQ